MALMTPSEVVTSAWALDNSFDVDNISEQFIEDVELIYIRPAFPWLYDEIVDENSGTPEAGDQTEWVTRIQPALALFCKAEVQQEKHVDSNNAGATHSQGEYYKQVSQSSVDALVASLKRRANARLESVVRWYDEETDLQDDDDSGDSDVTDNTDSGDIIF